MRGQGLLIGLALHKNQTDFINKLLKQKLLTVKASENVVRLLPPLNVTKKEINLALKSLIMYVRIINEKFYQYFRLIF